MRCVPTGSGDAQGSLDRSTVDVCLQIFGVVAAVPATVDTHVRQIAGRDPLHGVDVDPEVAGDLPDPQEFDLKHHRTHLRTPLPRTPLSTPRPAPERPRTVPRHRARASMPPASGTPPRPACPPPSCEAS